MKQQLLRETETEQLDLGLGRKGGQSQNTCWQRRNGHLIKIESSVGENIQSSVKWYDMRQSELQPLKVSESHLSSLCGFGDYVACCVKWNDWMWLFGLCFRPFLSVSSQSAVQCARCFGLTSDPVNWRPSAECVCGSRSYDSCWKTGSEDVAALTYASLCSFSIQWQNIPMIRLWSRVCGIVSCTNTKH